MQLFHIAFDAGPRVGQTDCYFLTAHGLSSVHLADGTNITDEPMGYAATGAVAEADLPQWFINLRDGQGLPPDPTPAPQPVPEEVTKLQLYKAAKATGQWAEIWAAIQSSEDAKLEWDFAISVRRDNPTVAALAAAQGWSNDDVDNLFRLAATQL